MKLWRYQRYRTMSSRVCYERWILSGWGIHWSSLPSRSRSTWLLWRASPAYIGHQMLKGGYTGLLEGFTRRATILIRLFPEPWWWCVIYTEHLTKCGTQIISKWKMFYRGNKKTFFLPGLNNIICKSAGVPLFDVDEVLLLIPSFTLFWSGMDLLLGSKGGKLVRIATIRQPWIYTAMTQYGSKKISRLSGRWWKMSLLTSLWCHPVSL